MYVYIKEESVFSRNMQATEGTDKYNIEAQNELS